MCTSLSLYIYMYIYIYIYKYIYIHSERQFLCLKAKNVYYIYLLMKVLRKVILHAQSLLLSIITAGDVYTSGVESLCVGGGGWGGVILMMVTSWHGHVLNITGPLQGDPPTTANGTKQNKTKYVEKKMRPPWKHSGSMGASITLPRHYAHGQLI